MRGLLLAVLLAIAPAYGWAAGVSFSVAIGTGGTCPQGTSYDDGCASAQASGSVSIPTLFTTYTGTNFSAHRPPWNVAAVDYPVGYAGTLTDPTVGLPSCVSKTGSGSGPYKVTVNSSPCTLSHYDFSLYNGICITIASGASGTTTFDNDHFAAGSNCNPSSSGIISVNTAGTVIIQYSEMDGSTTYSGSQGFIQNNTGGSTITVAYSAWRTVDQSAVQLQSASTLDVEHSYIENIGCCGNHGDFVIGNASSGTTSQTMNWNAIFARTGTATTDIYITNKNNDNGIISNAISDNNVLLGATNDQNGYLVNFSPEGIVGKVDVSNNYMGVLLDYGYYISFTGGTVNGPITCSGNIDMSTGNNATGTLGGTSCN